MSTASPWPLLRGAAAALLLLALAPAGAAAEYRIDPAHTYVNFAIDHLGFSTQRGRFSLASGSIDLDPESRAGHIDITIDAASLDTGLAQRDDILRGEGWFNVQAFPYILFRSERLVFDGERLTAVDGRLALLGEIRPLRLTVERFKCGFNLANRQRGCGADAQGVIRRSDFGLSNGLPFIGDEVRLHIQIEAYLP